VYQGKRRRLAEISLNSGHPASARTYLNRLKKSRDLVSDKPGQFCITEVGRVAVSRDNITAQQAQQGNVTPLFPEHDDETIEIS
jgi:hypothetical protein